MADDPFDTNPATKRRRRAFDAPPDVRMRQLCSGGWEIGGQMSGKQQREERVRDAAYSLWEEAGCPEGRTDEFWLAAEKLDARDAVGETDGDGGAASV